MRFLRPAAVAATALGAYSLLEPYWYRLVTHRLQVPSTVPALNILHLSDLHLKARDRRLTAFVSGLTSLEVDLILSTGDLIEDDSGIDPLVECFSQLKARLGRFYVLGSHDYHQSHFTSYTKYFTAGRGHLPTRKAATARLEAGLADAGWHSLTNSSENLATKWGKLQLTGVDDPYLGRHDLRVIRRHADSRVAIGLMHAPEVVSEWFLAGFDLVVAGHTHAGQVRLPFYGALVTNCALPTALAGGPHQVGNGWLHVSPGLGTGKFSPIRFNCRPEATLLTLVPEPQARDDVRF
jgi:predicted MPP superfamily phosphohydrolase